MARRSDSALTRLVRQFGAQAAPTRDRGYSSLFASMPVDYGVPAIPPAGPRPPEVTLPPVVDLSGIPEIPMLVPPSATAQIPRTMGTPALPPDWYPETPNRVWSPQPQPTTDPRLQRYTGEEDIPTVMPPAYGQPNVGVDITPEQFTLPPQQRIIQERPPMVDYGPITTPIERPLQEEMGYIEPQPPLDLTPGPQIAGTEQAFYEPQPVESAYAAPIQADYPYPQPQPQPTDIPQDDITNLIDAIIPETLESKTIDIPQEGPQWVEDPYTLAAQEAIDQAAIAQTNPSIYSPAMPPIIGEAPEITLADQIQQEDPYVIDYSDTYGEPILPQQELPQIFTPEPILGEPEVILPQEVGMPEIPTAATTTSRPDDQVIWDPEGMPHGESSSGVFEYTTDPLGDPVLQPGIVRKRLIGDTGEGTPVGVGPVITEGGVIVGERPESGIAETAETVIPAKTITPSGEVVGEADKTYTVDTEAGLDITQLPETAIAGEPAEGPMIEQIAETPETFVPKDVPPPPAVVEGGGEVVTQPPPPVSGPGVQQGALTAPGPGGWLYTGPQGYAQTRWSTSGAAQGDPVISYTPAVSGPQVNRETGEITEQPLSWWSNRAGYDFMQPGAELPTGEVGGTGTTGTTGTGITGEPEIGTKPEPFPETAGDTWGTELGLTKRDLADMPGDIGTIGGAYGGYNRAVAAVNEARSKGELTFEGITNVDGIANAIGNVPGIGAKAVSGIKSFMTDELGISDEFLSTVGKVKDWVFKPLDAISTDEISFTPFDLIAIAAGGAAALGTVVMSKVGGALIGKPIKNLLKSIVRGVTGKFSKKDQAAIDEWKQSRGGDVDTDPGGELDVGEKVDEKIKEGEVTDATGKGKKYAIFTDQANKILPTSTLNIGDKAWADGGKVVDIVKGGDGNAWAVTRLEGGAEVSMPITHGWGANKKPVTLNEFKAESTGGGGGGGGLLKTVWEWITSKRE